MDYTNHSNTTEATPATPSLGSLIPVGTGGMNLLGGNTMPMASGGQVSAPSLTGAAPPPLVRRPSKKVREAEKRAGFYLSPGQGSTNPRYVDWATRFAHNYLENFNRDNLSLFYGPGSTLTFMNTLNTPTAVACHQGAEAIYGYLQLFRSLKQIHLGQNGLQIQPMTDHHSITVTLEINMEPATLSLNSIID